MYMLINNNCRSSSTDGTMLVNVLSQHLILQMGGWNGYSSNICLKWLSHKIKKKQTKKKHPNLNNLNTL